MNNDTSTFTMFVLFIMSMLMIACMLMFLYLGYLVLKGVRKATHWVRRVENSVRTLPISDSITVSFPKTVHRNPPPQVIETPALSPMEINRLRAMIKPRRRYVVAVRQYHS